MKVLGTKVVNFWTTIFAIESRNVQVPFAEPIVVLSERTSATHHSGLLLLNNYYAKMEKNPTLGLPHSEIQILKDQNTFNGMITCHYCRDEILAEKITIDHYVPFYLGGRNHYNNLKLSCQRCNLMKGSIHPTEMPQTWALFQRNIKTKKFVRAITLMIEALGMPLDEKEHSLAKKLHLKELQWREVLREDRGVLEKAA